MFKTIIGLFRGGNACKFGGLQRANLQQQVLNLRKDVLAKRISIFK